MPAEIRRQPRRLCLPRACEPRRAAAVALAGTAVWAPGALRPTWPGVLLPIPPLPDARRSSQGLALRGQAGSTEFFRGRPRATLGSNGSYLGPTLRLHRGNDVEVSVTNALREDTTMHWHGLLVPGHLDGGPHQNIRPGQAWRPVLPVRQPAATPSTTRTCTGAPPNRSTSGWPACS